MKIINGPECGFEIVEVGIFLQLVSARGFQVDAEPTNREPFYRVITPRVERQL